MNGRDDECNMIVWYDDVLRIPRLYHFVVIVLVVEQSVVDSGAATNSPHGEARLRKSFRVVHFMVAENISNYINLINPTSEKNE